MLEFTDILYGRIVLPHWLARFIRLPEFVRLRGVRLSNVDSFEFKDFGGATRWEHGLAAAYLAVRCAEAGEFDDLDRVHLILAALLHDIATPPFAHTAEYVLENFDHELETQRILSATPSLDSTPGVPIFGSQLPRFRRECARLADDLGLALDPDEVARMVMGDGKLGYLIAGIIDLDNADNVTRACRYVGVKVDPDVPLRIAEWLGTQSHSPTDLKHIAQADVQTWLAYRETLYGMFFNSSDQELGRQAFLQHIMRRALRCGLPRRTLVWNTDDELLHTIADFDKHSTFASSPSLRELVERYRLLEETHTLVSVPIESQETLRALSLPQATTWIEEQLTGCDLDVFTMVISRRSTVAHGELDLFPSAVGALLVYKLGGIDIKHGQLPDWCKPEIPSHLRGRRLRVAFGELIRRSVDAWSVQRPWLEFHARRRESVIQNLQSNGDWSFRLSKNESLHAYPGTYVHAIPATLINCLGLKGELIVDPFGGTGQTAVEAIKAGCSVVTSDSNSIASLIARSKLTFLSPETRDWLRSLTADFLRNLPQGALPEFDLREKWHHPETLFELGQLRQFIFGQPSEAAALFLKACFSAVIPDCTARRGKQHGYFADNTPLPAELKCPPYQDAVGLFLAKITRNLDILERFYAAIEREGRNPEAELCRARVLRLDARDLTPTRLGLDTAEVAGIITSPPYLCMADYTLGQRLSYYWLFPDQLQSDFSREIGARRRRNQKGDIEKAYLQDLSDFVGAAKDILRPGGFLATVIGEPVANAFKHSKALDRFDQFCADRGLEKLWADWREIHWHRNHGYSRLRRERIAVHVLKG